MSLAKKIVALLAANVVVWIALRKILELNFYKQKKIIKEHFQCAPGEKLLDLGCGTGEFSDSFPKECYVGVDLSERNISYAAGRFDRKFIAADGLRLPFPDTYFDKVVIIGVLHHLSEKECAGVFAEIRRVLKPDGKLLVMEDAETDIWSVKKIQSFDQGAFIRDPREWERMLSEYFVVENKWAFRNGMCFYAAFILKRR